MLDTETQFSTDCRPFCSSCRASIWFVFSCVFSHVRLPCFFRFAAVVVGISPHLSQSLSVSPSVSVCCLFFCFPLRRCKLSCNALEKGQELPRIWYLLLFFFGRYLKLTLSLALHSSFAYFFTREYLKLALSLALYSTFSLLYFHFLRDLWKCFLMRLIDCLCAKQLAQLCRRVRTKTNMSAKQSLSALMLQVQINKFLMMRRELYRYPGFA